MPYCKICNSYDCDKHTFILAKTRKITEFSGSSPPEIFVGRYNYPNIYTGILSPDHHGDTKNLSSHEYWHKNKIPLNDVASFRKQLIYGRTQSNIKKLSTRFISTMQEVAMTSNSLSVEFHLKKPISYNSERENNVPLISNTAPLHNIRLQQNPTIKRKVDYIVNDTDILSKMAILELDKSNISSSTIMKILSAGLLGKKQNRKLVPTRWSITAVDDILSKEKLKKIKFYQQISDYLVFSAEYVGNLYFFLLIPDSFSFEVIEYSLKNKGIWHDHESFFARKNYASSVTGAYYANRLALTEYLEKIKRQASCLVIREISKEYNIPLGVGILRQTSREAFSLKPEKYGSLKEALNFIGNKLKMPLEIFTPKSILLKNHKKQSKLSQYF